MRPCKTARFCAFLCVSVRFFLPKWPAEKRKIVHNRANMCKKALLCNTPFSYTPFCVSQNSGVFPWENKHDSHIELLFRNAPAKSS